MMQILREMEIFVFAFDCVELGLCRLDVVVGRIILLGDGEYVSAFRTGPFRVVLFDGNVTIRVAEDLNDFARTLLFLLFRLRIRSRFANDATRNFDSWRCRTLPFYDCRCLSARRGASPKEPFDALLSSL